MKHLSSFLSVFLLACALPVAANAPVTPAPAAAAAPAPQHTPRLAIGLDMQTPARTAGLFAAFLKRREHFAWQKFHWQPPHLRALNMNSHARFPESPLTKV